MKLEPGPGLGSKTALDVGLINFPDLHLLYMTVRDRISLCKSSTIEGQEIGLPKTIENTVLGGSFVQMRNDSGQAIISTNAVHKKTAIWWYGGVRAS